MASTAQAVTSMHLIVTQHTDRLLRFGAAPKRASPQPTTVAVPVITWSCSTLGPDWSPFSAARAARLDVPYADGVRYSCTERMQTLPSPTADAIRLTEPYRTSPTANTPGMLVSNGSGVFVSGRPLGRYVSRS